MTPAKRSPAARRSGHFVVPTPSKSSVGQSDAVARNPISGSQWLAPLGVALITLIVFLPALTNGFVNWDDDQILVENNEYRSLGWTALRWMFTTFHMGHYEPFTWLSFALDYKIWGMDAFGYHLTNVILHAANAALFYLIAARLLMGADPGIQESAPDSRIIAAAAIAALLFSVHPLRVESVAWATERRDVLSALFILATVWCYLEAARLASLEFRDRGWRAAAWLFYVCSLLAKASGITLPLVLLVLDVYPLRRFGWPPQDWFVLKRRAIWLEKIPYVIVAILSGAVAVAAQGESDALKDLAQHTIAQRIAQAFYGLVFYLWKTLWPFHLAPLYQIRAGFNPFAWPYLASAALVVTTTVMLVILRRRRPSLLTAWIVYGLFLAPVLGFAQSGPQLVADRYSYLSCLSWAVLVGAGCLWLWRASEKGTVLARLPGHSTAISGAFLVLLLGLSVLTWKQAQIWRDAETLWRYAVSLNPSDIPHYNLGVALANAGKADEAVAHFRKSIEFNPLSTMSHVNLAKIQEARGDLAEAVKQLRFAVELDPKDTNTYR
jgi:hypothetical protein